jgi:hypothetical protein
MVGSRRCERTVSRRWRGPAISQGGEIHRQAVKEASRLAMGVEQEPHFPEQLLISSAFVFEQSLPLLGIAHADGSDE